MTHLISIAPRRPSLVLVLLVFAAACKQGSVSQTEEGTLVSGSVVKTGELERGATLSGRDLVIEGAIGDVTLTASDVETAELLFSIQGRGDTETAAQRQVDGLDIEEVGDEQTYVFRIVPTSTELTRVDVTGTIPRDVPIRLSAVVGDIAIVGSASPVDAKTQFGAINLDVESVDVRATTRTGHVDVHLRRLFDATRVRLATSNGDIHVALPTEANLSVQSGTRAGAIRVNDLTFENQRLVPDGAGSQFSARMGTGSGSLNANTQNGSITFSRIAAPVQPDADAEQDVLEVEPHDAIVEPEAEGPPAMPDSTNVIPDSASVQPLSTS